MTAEKIEEALELYVRPQLRRHGGDIRIEALEGGVLTVSFTGSCAECPSMRDTLRETVCHELQGRFNGIRSVEVKEGVSEELLAFARQLLRGSGRAASNQGG